MCRLPLVARMTCRRAPSHARITPIRFSAWIDSGQEVLHILSQIEFNRRISRTDKLTTRFHTMTDFANQPHILLLKGSPGIGKTTLLCKVASQLQQYRLGGFYTEEIRQAGQRQGSRLVTFRGEEGIIAHVKFDHRYRVGKYGVDIATVDRFAESELALIEAVDVYLIDEIGKMECFSSTFIDKIEELLNSNKPVIATVAVKGGGLIDKAKRWRGSELWELTHTNRDALVAQLVEWLETRI